MTGNPSGEFSSSKLRLLELPDVVTVNWARSNLPDRDPIPAGEYLQYLECDRMNMQSDNINTSKSKNIYIYSI